MRNMLIRETSLIDDALLSVAELLPATWRLDPLVNTSVDQGFDAVVTITGPGQERLTFAVQAKRSGTPASLLTARLREQARSTNLPLLYVSDYIGPTLREALTDEGISYADTTGWVRIASDAPLVLLTGRGAERSPRAGRPTAVQRLNGVAAGRIIRVLTETDPPFGVRDLAAIADVSPGSVSKLLSTLAAEGIVERDERGGVASVRRRALVQRWTRDYSFAKTNDPVDYYIAPRGLKRTLSRLSDASAPLTLTGSAGARRLLPESTTSVVPLRILALYTKNPKALANELGLVPADAATANTVVAVPQDRDVLATDVAPVALVLADLLTLPNRSDAEAEQLMDALARGDKAWEA